MVEIFGGIEGGASGSRAILLDNEGRRLGFAEGPHTNQWLIGICVAVGRLIDLIDSALQDAGLPKNTSISHLGLTLSGVDTEETKLQLITEIRAARPGFIGTIDICNDTIGVFLTETDGPALALISGTGSICKYIRPDLSFFRVGGYGYHLGDAGGAYYIAHRVICKFLEIEDGLIPWDHEIETVRWLIYKHFDIDQSLGLLYHFYENFNKETVAGLCERLVKAAHDGDPLCRESFHQGGIYLGRHVRSCLKEALKELHSPAEVLVVCCGKVFRSWDLLKQGFREAFRESPPIFQWNGVLKLVWLQATAAYGAARFAARRNGSFNLPRPKHASLVLDLVEIST